MYHSVILDFALKMQIVLIWSVNVTLVTMEMDIYSVDVSDYNHTSIT